MNYVAFYLYFMGFVLVFGYTNAKALEKSPPNTSVTQFLANLVTSLLWPLFVSVALIWHIFTYRGNK